MWGGVSKLFPSIRGVAEMSDCCVRVGGICSENDIDLYLRLGVISHFRGFE
ncbi:MAG: hypothetical protein ACKERG_04610 [Candidatus Hodgkinia cicadicola]